jgi:hypothetical protein
MLTILLYLTILNARSVGEVINEAYAYNEHLSLVCKRRVIPQKQQRWVDGYPVPNRKYTLASLNWKSNLGDVVNAHC